MKNKNFMKWGAMFMLMSVAMVRIDAQNEVAEPGGLHKFGENSLNVVTAIENIDSVTVGAVGMKYWASPDLTMLSGLNTYAWSNTIGTTAGSPVNSALMNFPATGSGNITVTETSAAGCVGTVVSIPVTVIKAPNITNITFSALACPPVGQPVPYTTVTGPTATLTITSDVSGDKQIIVTYNLTGPAGSTAINGAIANVGDGNTISLNGVILTQPGIYTLTLVSVTDRISVKSGITTSVFAPDTYTFTLNRTPFTGPIFHLPNH